MNERPFDLNSATQVWWFMAWRSVLVYLLLALPVTWVLSGWMPAGTPWASIPELVSMLILLFAQVFFIKLAVNRDFRSQSTGHFRLAALELDSPAGPKSSFTPKAIPRNPAAPLREQNQSEPAQSLPSFTPESVAHVDDEPSGFTPKNVRE